MGPNRDAVFISVAPYSFADGGWSPNGSPLDDAISICLLVDRPAREEVASCNVWIHALDRDDVGCFEFGGEDVRYLWEV